MKIVEKPLFLNLFQLKCVWKYILYTICVTLLKYNTIYQRFFVIFNKLCLKRLKLSALDKNLHWYQITFTHLLFIKHCWRFIFTEKGTLKGKYKNKDDHRPQERRCNLFSLGNKWMMKKKTLKKNPSNRKTISYSTEFRLDINLNYFVRKLCL